MSEQDEEREARVTAAWDAALKRLQLENEIHQQVRREKDEWELLIERRR
jgi:hypothetical protein